jgi:hypothetical protein
VIKRVVAVALAGCWALSAVLSHAAEIPLKLPDAVPPTPSAVPGPPATTCPSACLPFVEKTISLRKVYLVEEQAATTLPQLTLREFEAACAKETSLDIAWKEEPFVCTELTLKAREVEQEVACTKVEPVTRIDPSTGHPCTVYEQVPVVKKVKITVYDAVPEERAYVVRFPCVKPVERNVIVKRLAIDATTEPAIEKHLRAITVPCEAKVMAPANPAPCLSP